MQVGDILVAERNFGCGSSREHAPIAILGAGMKAVIAHSFARIFYRNAFNMGLLLLEIGDDVNKIKDGDKTLLTPDVLIDDRPVTLEAMTAKGVTVLHPDHAYCTAAPGRMFHRWAAVPLILGGAR